MRHSVLLLNILKLTHLYICISAHPMIDKIEINPSLTGISDYEQVPETEKKISEDLGNLVIGDMIIPNPLSTRTAFMKKEWPNGIVPYKIHTSVSNNPDRMKSVQTGISELNSTTCITLQPATPSNRGYILITAEKSGCFAVLGYTGKEQVVNLGSGCYRKGTVVHEIAHALGFFHEQSREDRDSFVKINFENIQNGKESQFRKTSEMTKEAVLSYAPYNYESVMHYSPCTFAKASNAFTIQSLGNSEAMGDPMKMGQRSGLSAGDIFMINEKYGFTSKCNL